MTTIIGIDLGTTNSAVGIVGDDGPRLIPNALGESLTPSVVGIDLGGKLLIGQPAKELQMLHPDRCSSMFKRQMGSEWTCQLGDSKLSPEQLSGFVLQALREDAEVHLGRSVERAVITVPAYFNEHQRQATLRAGRLAGMQVERILNEPTAAALAYGFHEAEEARTAMVIDLGGGTFDVSIVDQIEGIIEVRASSGEIFLGGEDFTRALASHLLQKTGQSFERAEMETPKKVYRLIQQCELAKCRLSQADSATVRLPNEDGQLEDPSHDVTVLRAEFEEWTERILTRIETPIRRALGDAGLKRADIDEVILVGGATRMCSVIEHATRLFGKPPHCRLNPDEVVALGGAIQAGLVISHEQVDDLVATDVSPFTLGTEATRLVGSQRQNGYFVPIINRNTTIPVSRVERFQTIRANQTKMDISVYQGDHRKVEKNLFLGSFTVTGIPQGPAGQEVDMRFTYDLNGVLEVEAEVVATRRKFRHVITKHAQDLSEPQVAQALAEMQSLKTHPREETVNHFLLHRAERVVIELPLLLRDELNDLIRGFEEAMELRDATLIETYRDQLGQFFEVHDRSLGEEPEDIDNVDW